MKKIKNILCVWLALCLLLSGVSLAEMAEAPEEAARVYTHDGRVTLIDGSCADGPVTGFEDAERVVDDVLEELGGDERTELEPWRTLNDACGNCYYVFQQMYDNTTVLGGAVKVITDGEGNMLGLTSSIVSELPKAEPEESISAEEAERIVLDHVQETSRQKMNVVGGYTNWMILPLALEVDIESEEEDSEGSRYVWVVYTDNPNSSLDQTSDLPYLAHYVTPSGEYLYSLPTIMPGDRAGASGFDASYIFEFMEPVDYTGYVDLSTGGEKEITVTVMRDRRTGMYYMGNIERRIVVADCWEFLYGGNRVMVEASMDNLEWDQVALLSLYNYCKAYDYYKAIGWSGGDGLGTPILILNDFCDIDHKPVDNAAYVGGYLGWQIFLASQGNDLSQCLDVLAHEYTHCVTGSVMTYNAYMNDYGAINEAMSDIQGKTCQRLMEGAEDVSWELGDRAKAQFRSLSEPHRFQQPEFTWDVYYVPNVRTPTVLNDEGGVHSNSSLLNVLAWRLYEKGGMTLEEGRSFWFTVDCAMVPGTDYAQLAELLPWALRAAGLERYDLELRRALDATRLGVEVMPEGLDEDRALLTLTLPENKAFDDEQWILYVVSVDLGRLIAAVGEVFSGVTSGDLTVLPQFLQSLLDPNGSTEPLDLEDEATLAQMKKELMDWVRDTLKGVVYAGNTNAGQDGRTMRMVCFPGHAVPVLLHGIYNQSTNDLDDVSVVVYLGGRWLDFGAVTSDVAVDEEALSADVEAYMDEMLAKIERINGFSDVLDLIFFPIQGGVMNVLPDSGLKDMEPALTDMFKDLEVEEEEVPQPRMSRPKLEEAPEEIPEAPSEEAPEAAQEEAADAA